MDTIGLGEIIGLAVIGLLLYGPEELPKFIRKVTGFITNVKAYAQSTLEEVKDLSGLEDESIEEIKQLGTTITDLRKPLVRQLGDIGLAAGTSGIAGSTAGSATGGTAGNTAGRAAGPGSGTPGGARRGDAGERGGRSTVRSGTNPMDPALRTTRIPPFNPDTP